MSVAVADAVTIGDLLAAATTGSPLPALPSRGTRRGW